MIAKFTHLRFSKPNRIFINLPLYVVGESGEEITNRYNRIRNSIEREFTFAIPNPPLYLVTKENKAKYDSEIRIKLTKNNCPVWLCESQSGLYDDCSEFAQAIEITNDINILIPNPIMAGVIFMQKDEVLPLQLDFKSS